ncbi:MAG: hypothetical protein K1X75_00750 [Leptospirales bacterium]|nr:hypothetical protein [Leptospirales bacterium]
MNGLCELHCHLYGCLQLDDLRWLAARRPPRWQIFQDSFRRSYGATPPGAELFADQPQSRALLERTALFREPGNFQRFQTCFDLVIAVAHTDAEELQQIAARVVGRQQEAFVEYRMLFSPREDSVSFQEKVFALAEGLASASAPGREARLLVSLPRDPEMRQLRYQDLRRLLQQNVHLAATITGIDFCHVEEGHPPQEAAPFLAEVLLDNQRQPQQALALLYHVGESFQDKSVESATRWCLEAAWSGAHRLGHCVALGAAPELYLGSVRKESARERAAQIAFELCHQESLSAAGYSLDVRALQQERQQLSSAEAPELVETHYDSERVNRLRLFQDWAMAQMAQSAAIIESCPTSNLRIAGLGDARHHPLPRFLAAGIKTCLGADDPGILDCSLADEFALVARWPRIAWAQLQRMKELAWDSRSECLVRDVAV